MHNIFWQRWQISRWIGAAVFSTVVAGATIAQALEPAAPVSQPASSVGQSRFFPVDQVAPPRALSSSAMEDLLLEKGIITLDDWIRIKAEEEQRVSDRAVVAEFSGSPRWYDRMSSFGYGMLRYNLGTNGKMGTYHDKSVGSVAQGSQPGFFFRRIRWVMTGQVSDHVSVFFQPDLASAFTASGSDSTHALTMRDAFGDYAFDKDKEFRFRAGLQRVPVSFDNWQASRVRMAFDRADATNSGATSERDLGLSVMWTPKIAQQRYKQMLDYMYGPGDYGVIHLAVYNGQGLNKPELNNNKHVGLRLNWPWELPGGYLMETGMNAYTGQFQVSKGTAAAGTSLYSNLDGASRASGNYKDERVNFSVYFPPQPFGFITEYTFGKGPQRNASGTIVDSALYGGYVQAHYQWKYSDAGLANFYSRYQEYHGGIKFNTGAPDGDMKELENGIAWMPDPQWEFTVAYAIREGKNLSKGTVAGGTSSTTGRQLEERGNLMRFQAVWFWN